MQISAEGRGIGGADPILVVDDEVCFREALVRELEATGLPAIGAAGRPAAAALMRGLHAIRTLILEPNLPGASWYQLLHEAARAVPPGRILVVTAFWSVALADEARLLGVRSCLPKPVAIARLREAVHATDDLPAALADCAEHPWPERPTSLALVEWEHVNQTIRHCAGNMSAAARQLGIHRPTLYKKLRKVPHRPALRSTDPNRITLLPVHARAIDGGETVLWSAHAGAQLVPTDLVAAVVRCRGPGTPEEHCQHAIAEGYVTADHRERLLALLSRLQARGFFVRARDLDPPAPRPGAGTAMTQGTQIAAAGLVTRDRPASAEASLRSYADNSLRAGRDDCFIVCDDSEQPSSRAVNQAMAVRLASDLGIRLRYLGPQEKRQYAQRLARASGLPVRTIALALLDELAVGFCRGANTNALMLDTVGQPFFCFDDDSYCRPARWSQAPSVALSSASFPVRLHVFADAGSLLAQVEQQDLSLLREHEAWLGLGCRDIAAAAAARGTLDLDEASPALLGDFLAGRGQVLATWSGLYGDSGSAHSTYYLMLTGPDRERLVATQADYQQALACRLVWKAPSGVKLVRNDLFQSVAFAADNRHCLPPFMPFLRASDSVFGQLLLDCFPHALIGCLPWSVHHAPDPPRRQGTDEVWRRAGELLFADLLELCLLSLPRPNIPPEPELRLRAIGQHLIDIGTMPGPERQELLYPLLVQRLAGGIARLQAVLREHGAQPTFWADDVVRTIESLRQRLEAKHPLLPGRIGRAGRVVG